MAAETDTKKMIGGGGGRSFPMRSPGPRGPLKRQGSLRSAAQEQMKKMSKQEEKEDDRSFFFVFLFFYFLFLLLLVF